MSNKKRTDYQAGVVAVGAIEPNTSALISPADVTDEMVHQSDSAVSRLDSDPYIRFATTVSGTDTVAITVTNDYPDAYSAEVPIFFTPAGANTGAFTVNVNGLGALGVYDMGGNLLSAANTFITTQGYIIVWSTAADGATTDGFVIIALTTSGGSSVTIANQANNRVITATATDDALNAETLLTWDGTKLGVGIASGDGTAHVHSATAGAVTANTSGDELVLENSTTAGMSILNPVGTGGNIIFGTTTDNDAGMITYSHNSGTDDTLAIKVNGVSSVIVVDGLETSFAGTVLPDTDESIDLGTTARAWQDAYIKRISFDDGTNYLDDYEEGTATITMRDATSAGNTGSTATAYYTKIGNKCHVSVGYTNMSTAGMTAGNTLYFTGLPFTSMAGPVHIGSCTYDTINLNGRLSMQPIIVPSVTYMQLGELGDNVGDAPTIVSDVSTGVSDLTIGITYFTT